MTVSRLSLFALVFVACAAPARAQSAKSGTWEVEAHGGGAWATSPTSGAAATLPVAQAFTTSLGLPSYRESSWLFGDGATLLNTVNTSLRAVNGHITPLDSILSVAGGTRTGGSAFGFRVARRFGSRYAAELTIDSLPASLEFTSTFVDGIEQTRSTFVSAFQGLLNTGPFTASNVSATTTSHEANARQVIISGALTVDLLTHGRFIPYVAGGVGLADNRGTGPEATINAKYAFSILGITPISEGDAVTIHLVPEKHDAVGVFGGGARYAMSSSWGFRFDVRAHVGGGKVHTEIDAAPSYTSQGQTGLIASGTSPSIQFSSNPPSTTLSGPKISSYRTFIGTGSIIRTNVAAGVYFRF